MTTCAFRSRCARATATRHGSTCPSGASRPRCSNERALTPDRDLAVALARELLHGSGALRVSIALDTAQPALIECGRLTAIVVRTPDGVQELAHDAGAGVALPELPRMRRLPPFEIDAATGSVAGVLGGLELLGRAVREIAGLLPGASVVAAEYETTDPAVALGLGARPGEPVFVLLGEHEFELDC